MPVILPVKKFENMIKRFDGLTLFVIDNVDTLSTRTYRSGNYQTY